MTDICKKITPQKIRRMMYGLDALIAHEDGSMAPMVNLDNAATTPPFRAVVKEILKQLLYYGSIGRGTGQKSRHTSIVYAKGRETVLDFVGAADDKYTMFYAANTTDGINKLASALIDPFDRYGNLTNEEILIVSTRMEHHANDLPWRERAHTVYAEVDKRGRLILDDFERILGQDEYKDMTKYVTVCAASNVTGYVNDVHKIARVAHRFNAKIIVDGAQIVAHRKFSMLGRRGMDEDIDFFVFSAHKMYSPYGGGVVVGLADVLNERMPQFYGGGMVATVNDDTEIYADEPDLYEAGSPNYPGVVGMVKAIEILKDIGFDYIAAHEQNLLRKTLNGLEKIKNVTTYGDCDNTEDRVGVLVFNIDGWEPEDAANELALRAGIAVRHAAFCAHPYVRRLSTLSGGMIRCSFGIYTTEEEVDLLIQTVEQMAREKAAPSEGFGGVLTKKITRQPNDRG